MDEKNTRQPRGIYIPEDILTAFITGAVNAKEMLLLAFVDSFVSSEAGCFASNAYLAELVGVKESMVMKMLARLQKADLIQKSTTRSRKREILTCYSRIPQVNNLKAGGQGVKNYTGCKKLHRSGVKNYTPCMLISKYDNNCSSSSNSNDATLIKDDKKEQAKQLASYFFEKLGENRKLQRKPSITKWCMQFSLLLGKDSVPFDTVHKTLVWYCERLPKLQELFLPRIYSAQKFRDRFDDLHSKMIESSTTETKESLSRPGKRILKKLRDHNSIPDKYLYPFIENALQGSRELHNIAEQMEEGTNGQTQILSGLLVQRFTTPAQLALAYIQRRVDKLHAWKNWNPSRIEKMQVADDIVLEILIQLSESKAASENWQSKAINW